MAGPVSSGVAGSSRNCYRYPAHQVRCIGTRPCRTWLACIAVCLEVSMSRWHHAPLRLPDCRRPGPPWDIWHWKLTANQLWPHVMPNLKELLIDLPCARCKAGSWQGASASLQGTASIRILSHAMVWLIAVTCCILRRCVTTTPNRALDGAAGQPQRFAVPAAEFVI